MKEYDQASATARLERGLQKAERNSFVKLSGAAKSPRCRYAFMSTKNQQQLPVQTPAFRSRGSWRQCAPFICAAFFTIHLCSMCPRIIEDTCSKTSAFSSSKIPGEKIYCSICVACVQHRSRTQAQQSRQRTAASLNRGIEKFRFIAKTESLKVGHGDIGCDSPLLHSHMGPIPSPQPIA
jgi:hypothetical protein